MADSDISLRHDCRCFAEVVVFTECVYCDHTCFTTPSIKLKNLNHIVRLYCSVVKVHKLFVASWSGHTWFDLVCIFSICKVFVLDTFHLYKISMFCKRYWNKLIHCDVFSKSIQVFNEQFVNFSLSSLYVVRWTFQGMNVGVKKYSFCIYWMDLRTLFTYNLKDAIRLGFLPLTDTMPARLVNKFKTPYDK
jgi:hypothetical protein